MRGWPVLALTIVTMAGTNAAETGIVAGSTPMQSSKPGELVLPVMVNGLGPFAFVLDTGSTHTTITDTLAQRLRAPAVAKALFRSSIGAEMRAVVNLDRLELGPARDENLLASLVPEAMLDATGRLAGVIGQDVLASRRYTIDFVKRRVVWHAEADELPLGRISLPLSSEDGRFLLELHQRDSSTLRLVPDSGAEGLVLYRRENRPLPPFMLSPGRTVMSTLTSTTEVQPIRVGELSVGGADFFNLPGVLIDQQHSAAGADGLLPLHLFTRVTIDGPGRRFIVE